ncbi:MAG: nicotinate-nucleotide adenylyltransferase [bacterium]
MQRIGIMGGTFNPVHKGHIAIAQAARKRYRLDRVIFVPSGNPPHKTHEYIAPKEHRFKMVKLAISGKKDFHISRVEIDRAGYSYAVDTFNELKKEYKGNALLYYIMGMDSINEILDWKKPMELFNICQFIVATRLGAKIKTMRRILKFPPVKLHEKQVHLIEVRVDISSTKIRESIKKGDIPAKLLNPRVINYIKRNKLYDYTGT